MLKHLRKFLRPLKASATRPRLRLAAKIAAGIIVSVLLLAWLGVPALTRWALETKASEALGRRVSVEKILFNPFTLAVDLNALQLASADGKSSLLSVGHLHANLSLLSIWYRGPVLDAVRLDQPLLHFARVGENYYSFSDIIERLNRGRDKAKPGQPLQFSVNNIELHDGRIEFEDRPIGKTHRVEAIELGVPFVSNLPTRVELAVVPHLDAKFNGTAIRLDGQLKPFASETEASLDIRLAPLDLTQYLGYAPVRLPVVLERGELGCNLHLVWGQGAKGAQRFTVAGELDLKRVSLHEPDGTALFRLDALGLKITSLEPLASPLQARIKHLQLTAPELQVRRLADGTLNLQRLAGEPDKASQASVRPAIVLEALDLDNGRLDWSDAAVSGGFATSLNELSIHLRNLDLAKDAPASVALQAKAAAGGTLAFSGELNPVGGVHAGRLQLDSWQIAHWRPHYAAALGPAQISATLAAEGTLKLATAGEATQFSLDGGALRLADASVRAPGQRKALMTAQEIRLDGVAMDLAKREARLDKFAAQGASWALSRNEKGHFNLLTAFEADEAHAAKTEPATQPEASASPWALQLGEAQISGWRVSFEDRSGAQPVGLELHDLSARLADWSNRPGQRAQLSFSTRVNRAGRLNLAGSLATAPVQGSLRADIRDVDLLALQPYVDQHFKVLVTRGHFSGKGQVDFDLARAGTPDLRFRGDLAINEFSSLDRINDADFLQWRHLGVADARFSLDPLVLEARELRLEDFYSRLILDAAGRFNLRELAAETDEPEPAQSVPAPVAAAAAPRVRLDRLVLSGGSVNYSDRFVKPNYDARLAAVNGTMTELSSDPKTVAQLELKAAVDGAAPVIVAGQLNPLRQDRFLDLQAKVTGVDLTSVSTYAAKYVGYGISKGKLSMDLKYQIRDRKLTAENQLYLDQLTFGERVDSPEATKLPVLFAVALLKNSKGEIDINLPIGGSLDDPQFSVGGIVVKVIVNLITKAITSPFALIGSLFGGGGEELSYLDYAPGKTGLSADAVKKLQTLAKALADRPALRLDIKGQVDPAADLDGINRARLLERIRALKAAQWVKAGREVGDVDALAVEAAEYPKLLAEVYASEKIADKPRNALGAAKEIPLEEMEKLLLGHFARNAPDLSSLAAERARAARDWLITEGKIAPERIFLIAADTAGAGKDAGPKALFSLK